MMLRKNVSIGKQYPFCIAILFAITLFLKTESAFTAQELMVGFITGRGDDAAVEQQAFENAEVEKRLGICREKIRPNRLTLVN